MNSRMFCCHPFTKQRHRWHESALPDQAWTPMQKMKVDTLVLSLMGRRCKLNRCVLLILYSVMLVPEPRDCGSSDQKLLGMNQKY